MDFSPFWHPSHSLLPCLQNCTEYSLLQTVTQLISNSAFFLLSCLPPPPPISHGKILGETIKYTHTHTCMCTHTHTLIYAHTHTHQCTLTHLHTHAGTLTDKQIIIIIIIRLSSALTCWHNLSPHSSWMCQWWRHGAWRWLDRGVHPADSHSCCTTSSPDPPSSSPPAEPALQCIEPPLIWKNTAETW